jgi:hypothetical protein
MAIFNNFFRDVGILMAKKQEHEIDAVTEEAPILAQLPMQEASHGIRNVYEELLEVDGAQLVNLDDELPTIGSEGTLGYQDLGVLGGIIRVGEDKANKFGGAAAYFAKKMPSILRQTGADTEKSLIYNTMRPYAKANGREQNAGGATVGGQNSMVCVKWVEGETIGLFDAQGFGDGKVFDMLPLNGGNAYEFTDTDSKTKVGYGERIKAYFALQLSNPRNVSSIVNIDLAADATTDTGYKALPTEGQINRMIRDARGNPANTLIYCHPAVLDAIGVYKSGALQMVPSDNAYSNVVATWNGIRFVTSYNFDDGTEAVVA